MRFSRWGTLFLVLTSAVILRLAFQPTGFWPLAWIGLVPFFVALVGKKPRQAFTIGLLWGLVFHGLLNSWLFRLVSEGSVSYLGFGFVASSSVAVLSVLLVAFWCALPYALLACFSSWAHENLDIRWRSLLLAALFTVAEFLRSLGPLGYPWGWISHSQVTFLPVIQICEITGVYGVTFLVVWWNGFLVDLLMDRSDGTRRVWLLGLPAVVVLLCLAWGECRLHSNSLPDRNLLRVAAIQANITPEMKWNPSQFDAALATYLRLSEEALRQEKVELLVWPETSVPACLSLGQPATSAIQRFASQHQIPLLIGALEQGKRGTMLNTAYAISAQGVLGDRYHKVRLIPFGEYTPLRERIPWMNIFAFRQPDFAAGDKITPLKIGKVKMGVVICFESLFPIFARTQTRQGAEVLTVMTNDGWFGRSAASYEHASIAVLRAVENRRWVVRAANTGISCFITPTGKVIARKDLDTQGILTLPLERLRTLTFYTQHGDWLPIFCLLLVVVTGLIPMGKKNSKRKKCDESP